jgi:nitroimidazol reductase NimA-like FMN-containing flavoprotein (pyridoxamine 5'-phosphate oxidase superfamily)
MPNKRVDRLTIAECRELLDSHHFGRLGFMDYVGVFPSIIPVNYLLNEGKIVIRTDAGSKLSAAIRGAPVAFELDGVDETCQVGWTVVLHGHAEEVTD